MADAVLEIAGHRLLLLDADGAPLRAAGDVSDVISAAWGHRADLVATPATRLDPGFFNLKTGLAGEAIQTFVNYRLRLVVIGDIASHLAASAALRDFVRESNRGRHVWFVDDLKTVERRLAAER